MSVKVISLSGGIEGKSAGSKLAEAEVMASQWGDIGFVPLRAGFGENVSFQMGFDENGHKVSETWDATARGTPSWDASRA